MIRTEARPGRTLRTLAALVVAALLSACATDRPIAFRCTRMAEFRVPVPVPQFPDAAAPALVDPLEAAIRGAASRDRGFVAGDGPALLVLSGGGKWGAYGAGLMKAWSSRTAPGERRPEFDVVTGVSTGALQATFAFLGSSVDDQLVDAYRIQAERQLAIRHGGLFFLRHASMADLSPLRGYAASRVGPLLPRVADEAAKGRKLFVGTIDALDGRMYAVDLTRMASEMRGDPGLVDCYTGALLASAAIPVVFRQVTIEGRPYYDAGVRRAVFLTEFQKRVQSALAGKPGTLYVLFNGDPGVPVRTRIEPKLLPTVGRLRELVFDQVEHDSVYITAQQSGLRTRVATAAGHGCPIDVEDEDIFNPVLMRCLTERGELAWSNGSPWRDYAKKLGGRQ